MLEWTTVGAMIDKNGHYSLFPAPIGRHVVKAMMMGYVTGTDRVEVAAGDTVIVDFVLTKDPTFDPSKVIVIPEQFEHEYDPWPYDASIEPVRWDALEFELRYVMTAQDDSILVNVVAEGKNITDVPFSMCGRFIFWDRYRLSNDFDPESVSEGDRMRAEHASVLNVTADNVPKSLECTAETVDPGDFIARGLSFAFDPKAYEYWTGELQVRCVFLAGHEGMSDIIWRVDLGDVIIPIRPLGQVRRVAPPR